LRRVSTALAALALVVAGALWLPGFVTPTIARSRIRTAVADVGPLESVITASGLVVPEIEQVISSPVDARVLRILKTTGATLAPGDPIADLDVSEARLAVDRISRERAIKQNEQAQQRLALEKRLIDLNADAGVKKVQLDAFRQQLARDRALFEQGLLSRELLKKSELAVTEAQLELERLDASRDNATRATRTEIDGLALQMATLEGEEAQARRTLELARPRAERGGVLTWVLPQEGVVVRTGDPIARIADLHAFRVDATVSDVHARELAAGQAAVVKIDDEALEGTVSSVLPTVQNGSVTVRIALAKPAHPLLRSNLRVDVYVVRDRKPRVVRIARGPFAVGEGSADVFVIRGDRAVRTRVLLGIASFDRYEVVRGLVPGDEAIISDMSDYARLNEVRIR
jgi:HlyD family secretion protein